MASCLACASRRRFTWIRETTVTKAACASLLAAILLAACGGGNSSSSGATAPTTGTVAKRVSVGDVYTYSRRDTTVGGATSTYLFSREYQVVNDDGSSIDVETFSDAFAATVTSVSANGGVTASTLKNDAAARCTYSPENIGAASPYQVGKAWDNSWTQTCGSTVTRGTNKGSIVAMESVTVPAGTFNAFKEVYVITTQQTTPASDQVTTSNITCWRDADLKQYVKCDFALSYSVPAAAGADAVASTSYELHSYLANAGSKGAASAARFAGLWNARFYGSEIGQCVNLTISPAGAISGNCEGRVSGPYAGSFAVTGSVDAQGNISFGPSPTGDRPTFTGRFRTISDIDGTWSANPNLAGGWAAYHN